MGGVSLMSSAHETHLPEPWGKQGENVSSKVHVSHSVWWQGAWPYAWSPTGKILPRTCQPQHIRFQTNAHTHTYRVKGGRGERERRERQTTAARQIQDRWRDRKADRKENWWADSGGKKARWTYLFDKFVVIDSALRREGVQVRLHGRFSQLRQGQHAPCLFCHPSLWTQATTTNISPQTPTLLSNIHHIKGQKECYSLWQNTTCEFSGWSLLSSYKMTLKQQLNGENWDAELGHLSASGGAKLFSYPVLGRMLLLN